MDRQEDKHTDQEDKLIDRQEEILAVSEKTDIDTVEERKTRKQTDKLTGRLKNSFIDNQIHTHRQIN